VFRLTNFNNKHSTSITTSKVAIRGNKMNTKKILSVGLSIGILSMNYIPCLAYSILPKSSVIKAQVNEYKFQNVNLDWWKDYNDEYLNEYIVKAINENQDLKIATLKVEEARQNVKIQFASELPSASIGGAPGVLKNTGESSSSGLFALPMYVSYEADIFGKNHDKTKSKKKSYEASKSDEKAAYISIASQVGSTYFNIIKADKLINLQEEIIKEKKQIFELTKLSNSQGIASTADVVRAKKSYVIAVADLTDLQKSREKLLTSLAVLTGESPNNISEFKRVSYEELPKMKTVPDEISSDIIVQRPDYMAAELQVQKAGIDVRVAKKEFLPTVNILGLIAFLSTSSASSLSWTNALAFAGGSAMIPLFTGGKNMATLRLKKNQYEQILQSYYKTNLTAIQEVNDALCSLKLDNEKYQNNLTSYEMQKKDYVYIKNKYNQGILSKLDLLQQQETLLTLNKTVVSSKTDCYINQISLYKAVGGKI